MAEEPQLQHQNDTEDMKSLFSSYVGLSFSVFLALLPNNLRSLPVGAFRAEEDLRQMRSRRQEDSKANARITEIFASQRNAWRDDEKCLLRRIDAAAEEIARLRAVAADSKARVEELELEVAERDEMIVFVSRRLQQEELGGCKSREHYGAVPVGNKSSECFHNEEEQIVGTTNGGHVDEQVEFIYQQQHTQNFGNNPFDSEFMPSKLWTEKASLWQDVEYESLEPLYNAKQFVARRESPWNVDGDAAGVSSKLQLLEQELINLDKIGKSVPSNVSSSIKKQARKYQSLSENIDDLCRRIGSDPCEPSLGSEFQTQKQTDFLLEAFRLQQGASETGQKLMGLQAELGKLNHRDELISETTLTTRRFLDSIRNNFKEIQRNLEIWLAKIIGDLEGVLSRDGASRLSDYYISRYPFVQ